MMAMQKMDSYFRQRDVIILGIDHTCCSYPFFSFFKPFFLLSYHHLFHFLLFYISYFLFFCYFGLLYKNLFIHQNHSLTPSSSTSIALLSLHRSPLPFLIKFVLIETGVLEKEKPAKAAINKKLITCIRSSAITSAEVGCWEKEDTVRWQGK